MMITARPGRHLPALQHCRPRRFLSLLRDEAAALGVPQGGFWLTGASGARHKPPEVSRLTWERGHCRPSPAARCQGQLTGLRVSGGTCGRPAGPAQRLSQHPEGNAGLPPSPAPSGGKFSDAGLSSASAAARATRPTDLQRSRPRLAALP